MTVAAAITRRQALAVFGALAATALASPLGALVPAPTHETELEGWLATALGGADLAAIAAAWRARHPDDASREAVTRDLLAGRRPGESLGAYLARRVAEEHAAERAEVVDGWYLTPTEARLVVLAAR